MSHTTQSWSNSTNYTLVFAFVDIKMDLHAETDKDRDEPLQGLATLPYHERSLDSSANPQDTVSLGESTSVTLRRYKPSFLVADGGGGPWSDQQLIHRSIIGPNQEYSPHLQSACSPSLPSIISALSLHTEVRQLMHCGTSGSPSPTTGILCGKHRNITGRRTCI
jgi:hypothetical protein